MQWLCNASIGALTGARMRDDIYAIVKHLLACLGRAWTGRNKRIELGSYPNFGYWILLITSL